MEYACLSFAIMDISYFNFVVHYKLSLLYNGRESLQCTNVSQIPVINGLSNVKHELTFHTKHD